MNRRDLLVIQGRQRNRRNGLILALVSLAVVWWWPPSWFEDLGQDSRPYIRTKRIIAVGEG